MRDKSVGCSNLSLKYHNNHRKNLLVYKEIEIMRNDKSTLNSCNTGVLCRYFGRFEI